MRSRPLHASLASVAAPLLIALGAACGGPKATDASPNAPGAASANAADGGAADSAPPEQHPFAGSATEAAQLMGVAVEKKSSSVEKCVREYRTRKNLPHERVTISMGIDQEGRLLGATLPKGKSDPTLAECIQRALADAPFPRSHSGVISITKTYEEIVQ